MAFNQEQVRIFNDLTCGKMYTFSKGISLFILFFEVCLFNEIYIVILKCRAVGFSFLVRHLGVRNCLLIFPCLLFFASLLTNLVPSLWLLFYTVSVLKALTYSLNEPVKELLYMPTSGTSYIYIYKNLDN